MGLHQLDRPVRSPSTAVGKALSRMFDLLAWLGPASSRFPKTFGNTVTQRLMDAALDCQDALYLAQSRRGRERAAALRDADTALNRLRLYLRLARH